MAKVTDVVIIREKKWYIVNGTYYFGPYNSLDAAKKDRQTYCTDSVSGVRGCIEYLDPLSPRPSFGLHGPLKPRYPMKEEKSCKTESTPRRSKRSR